jgi:hypothetical protein
MRPDSHTSEAGYRYPFGNFDSLRPGSAVDENESADVLVRLDERPICHGMPPISEADTGRCRARVEEPRRQENGRS